jgi:hypothetical protein
MKILKKIKDWYLNNIAVYGFVEKEVHTYHTSLVFFKFPKNNKRNKNWELNRKINEAANEYLSLEERSAFIEGVLWWNKNLWRFWENEKPRYSERMVMIKQEGTGSNWDILKVKYIQDKLERDPNLKIISWFYLDEIM